MYMYMYIYIYIYTQWRTTLFVSSYFCFDLFIDMFVILLVSFYHLPVQVF